MASQEEKTIVEPNCEQMPKNGDQMSKVQQKPNENSEQDRELLELRAKMIGLFPQMEQQVKQMEKDDLIELLQIAEKNQDPQAAAAAEKKQNQRKKKIKEILEHFPETNEDIGLLDDQDIDDIHAQIRNPKSSSQAKNQGLNNFSQAQQNNFHPPKNNQQQLNVYEMKKSLIDRLPEYRNQIRNLPDEQIRKMYLDLQEEEGRTKKRRNKSIGQMYMERPPSRASYPYPSPYQTPSNYPPPAQIKAQPAAPSQSFKINEHYTIHQKKDAKLRKQQRCKISFYLSPQDLYDAEDPQKFGLTKIIEALSKAFKSKEEPQIQAE